ncbi:MAG: BatA and WFA domain-containing protein [Gemmataceae bacterium]
MRTLFPLGVVALVLLALPGVAVFAADLAGYGPDVNAWLESRLAVSHRVALALPAAVALFCVPPIIILLYFLRLKRKPVPVPSTFLWKKSIEDLHVNRLMQWLRQNVLLLLQLLAILALIYGVLGPRLHGSVIGGRHYILMLDNSASMTATDVKPTRLDWAKAEALKEIDAATDADTGMVIVFSDVAEIRQSYTTNRAALKRAVEAIQPTQRPTRLDEALNLAASLANPSRSTENEAVAPTNFEPGKERQYVGIEGLQADVHLYSDGRFPPVPEFALANLNLNYHVPPAPEVDGTSDNVAVLRFEAERDTDNPSKVVARAGLRNYRGAPATVRPRLELKDAAGRVQARYDADEVRGKNAPVTVPAKAEKPDLTFTLTDIPEDADLTLELVLDGHTDAFAADDRAWVVLGVVRKAKVLVVGPGNAILRYVLDAASMKRVAEVTYHPPEVLLPTADPKDYLTPAWDGRYDLVVFDRCAPADPELLPRSNTFFIGTPPPPFKPAGQGKAGDPLTVKAVTGPSVRGWQARHPVTRNLSALDEVDVAEAFQFPELPARTQRLIEGSQNLVLLAAVPRQAFTDLVQTFPLVTADGKWNTNWPLKLSFPLFVRNVVLALGNVRDAGAEESIKPGQVKHVRAGGATSIKVTAPDGGSTTLERGTRADFTVAGTDKVGVYAARWTEPGGADGARRFAVNLFDPLESDLAVAQQVTVGSTTVAADAPRKQPMDLWKWPVLLGLLVLVGEWWVYNRRVSI